MVPKACDTTLQQINKWGWGTWFWMAGYPLRPMSQLISVYHDTVGRGGVLELDFAIDRDGLVHPDHAQLYKQLGDWIRACYGKPLAQAAGNTTLLTLSLPAGARVDRVVIEEDQAAGQRIRAWTVEAESGGAWASVTSGKAVGNKRIATFPNATPSSLRLRVTESAAIPSVRRFAAFAPCPAA